MTDPAEVERIVAGLSDFEREWITGWQGPGGAAFNVVATDLYRKGLLRAITNWALNELGLAVRQRLMERGETKGDG